MAAASEAVGLPIQPGETLLWTAAAVLECVLVVIFAGAVLGNDSCQYLSIAESLASGKGLVTPIVFYDTELSHLRIPAPVTTFPPLFPALVAVPLLFGVPVEAASLLVTCASFALLVPVLVPLARETGASPSSTRVLLTLYLLNATALGFAHTALSESLFTLLLVGTVLALVWAEHGHPQAPERERLWLLTAAGLAGLACLARYAGYFLVVGVVSYCVLARLWLPPRRVLMRLLYVSPSLLPVALLVLRNWSLTHTLRGGNTKHVVHSLRDIGRAVIYSPGELLFGKSSFLDARESALVLLIVMGLGLYGWRLSGRSARRRADGGLVTVGWVAFVYTVLITASGAFMVFTLGFRTFYPLLPLAFIALAAYLPRVEYDIRSSRRLIPLAILIGGMFVLSNAISFMRGLRRPDSRDRVQACLLRPSQEGPPLLDLFNRRVPGDARIAATNGQAALFVLRRSGVALVEAEYSNRKWEEPQLRGTMESFGLDYLVLFPGDESGATIVQRESRFLTSLLGVEHRPTWLTELMRNDCALVLERTHRAGQ